MRRWCLLASLALTGMTTLSGCGSVTNRMVSYPAPVLYRWSAQAAAGSATPQQAFAAGMQLDLCHPVAARSVTITWLASGPNFGVVWVVADCRNNAADTRPVQSLFLAHRVIQQGSTSDQWLSGDVGFTQKPPAGPIPAEVQAQTPPWLSLPPDAYLQTPTVTNTQPLATILSWTSATNVFITGRFEGSATPPSTGASTISVTGHAGWLVEDQGMASVVVPLASGQTFFFSGTTTGREVQLLATEMLSHLEYVLPLNPSPPGSTPTA